MKLKDILDMEYYLKNECYCPGEIYSSDGFFFQVFDANSECKIIGERNDDRWNFITVITTPVAFNKDKAMPPQIVIFFRNNELTKIEDSVRYDATENNIKVMKEIISGEKDGGYFDEYEKGSTARSLNEILSIADAIMIS